MSSSPVSTNSAESLGLTSRLYWYWAGESLFRPRSVDTSPDGLQTNLECRDYVGLIAGIRALSPEERLQFLREPERQRYWIVLYEQGKNEFLLNPRIEMVEQVVLPFFRKGDAFLKEECLSIPNPIDRVAAQVSVRNQYCGEMTRLIKDHLQLEVDFLHDLFLKTSN